MGENERAPLDLWIPSLATVFVHPMFCSSTSAALFFGSRLAMEGACTGTARMDHVVQTRLRQASDALPGPLSLVVNVKEHGLIHRLAEGSQGALRDRRRTVCGWRAGSSASKVNFCSTTLWPPFGAAETRLCGKCFPNPDAATLATQSRALEDDPITSSR